MHRGCAAVLFILVAAVAAAQETQERSYTESESPFMGTFDFSLQAPVEVFAEVKGVRLRTLRIDTQQPVSEGTAVRCQITASGSNVGEGRPNVTIMMLLEDANGKGVARAQMEPFRPRPGRSFEEVKREDLPGDALLRARKIFIMIEVT